MGHLNQHNRAQREAAEAERLRKVLDRWDGMVGEQSQGKEQGER